LSLVLDGGDGALVPPVNALWEILDGFHLEVGGGGRVGEGRDLYPPRFWVLNSASVRSENWLIPEKKKL